MIGSFGESFVILEVPKCRNECVQKWGHLPTTWSPSRLLGYVVSVRCQSPAYFCSSHISFTCLPSFAMFNKFLSFEKVSNYSWRTERMHCTSTDQSKSSPRVSQGCRTSYWQPVGTRSSFHPRKEPLPHTEHVHLSHSHSTWDGTQHTVGAQ